MSSAPRNTSVNEKLAGIALERDLTACRFARGSTDFEIDNFEELALRASVRGQHNRQAHRHQLSDEPGLRLEISEID